MRLVLTTLLILSGATVARADDPRIYLSWGAANGLPGAASSLARLCGDTTRVDTLNLSFDPGRACSTFAGMTATLWFRALDGDSLGPLWESPGGTQLPHGMSLEFAHERASGYPFPWSAFGIGHAGYLKPGSNARNLRVIWAVSALDGARVEPGTRYALARLLLRRPAAGTPGCDQPVCVEWTEATMAYRPGDEPSVSTGERFVGINAAGGEQSCSVEPSPPHPGAAKPGKSKRSSTGR